MADPKKVSFLAENGVFVKLSSGLGFISCG